MILAAGAVGYYFGKKSIENSTQPQRKDKYSSLNAKDHDDEEDNEMALIPSQKYFSKDEFEDHQKEHDRLMQELSEYKKKEKKYQAEIQLLKSKTKSSQEKDNSGGSKKQNPSDLDDLISDRDMNVLLEKTGDIDSGKINLDEIEKEMNANIL